MAYVHRLMPYLRETNMRRIGKQVGDDLYVHVSAVEGLADEEYRARILAAIEALPRA